MAASDNYKLRTLEMIGGYLLIMRFIFSLDWMGLMNIFTLLAAILLLADRLNGKVFPMLLIAAVILQAIDVVMGIIAMFSAGSGAMLLMVRTVMFGFFIVVFLMRFFSGRASEKLLFISAVACTAADLLLSALTGCVDMPVLGQTAFVYALLVIAHVQKSNESDAGTFLTKIGAALAAICALTAMWGIAAGTGGDCAFSSLYKIFGSAVGENRVMDLMHLLPNINWNLFGGLAGAALGAYIFVSGRKLKS